MIKTFGSYDLADAKVLETDLHITALGFEERCSALIRFEGVVASECIFLQFPTNPNHSYFENLKIAKSVQGAKFIQYNSLSFLQELRATIAESNAKRVSLDISSMNRTMIAAVFSCLCQGPSRDRITVLYLSAQYKKPDFEFSDIQAAGPVLPEFSAFDEAEDLPMAVLMGAGYEYGIGAGLINLMEPELAICMRAVGEDTRFEEDVQSANLNFEFPGIDAETVSYEISQPQSAYSFIHNTIQSLILEHRISLIPMGPKILSSLFCLAAISHIGRVALWRVVRRSPPPNSVEAGPITFYDIDTKTFFNSRSILNDLIEFV